MEEYRKEQWSLMGLKKPFPHSSSPFICQGVWRISSEKWYCKLYRGRNWVLPRMKSNCIVNTFSFSFYLSPFCYFLFPSPDFYSFVVSHFHSDFICHFTVLSSFALILETYLNNFAKYTGALVSLPLSSKWPWSGPCPPPAGPRSSGEVTSHTCRSRKHWWLIYGV